MDRPPFHAGPERILLQWHVTERCNLRCTHGYQESSESGDEPTTAELHATLERVPTYLSFTAHRNIGFLILLAFVLVLIFVGRRRRTTAGDAALSALRERFDSLRRRAKMLLPGGMTNETAGVLLAGLVVLWLMKRN